MSAPPSVRVGCVHQRVHLGGGLVLDVGLSPLLAAGRLRSRTVTPVLLVAFVRIDIPLVLVVLRGLFKFAENRRVVNAA